ncbi:MAG: hypothetical protein IGS54_01525 [Elainella sp. C42_A2020_010]|nr:hypothetical protein [Elainella sp. C42_A2020_010]
MNSQRSLNKLINSDIGGGYSSQPVATPELTDDASADTLIEDASAELYPTLPPVTVKKHSPDFISQRLKVRQIAETRLLHLADELSKLADEVRYHHPLMAEILDEAWDATEEALTLMSDGDA